MEPGKGVYGARPGLGPSGWGTLRRNTLYRRDEDYWQRPVLQAAVREPRVTSNPLPKYFRASWTW